MLNEKRINIIVSMTVPEAVGYDGKTGSLVRLVEIFKCLKQQDNKIKITFNITEWMAKYFQENGVEAEYHILKPSLKFSGYVGLCLKAFFLTIKSFFIFNIQHAKKEEEKIVAYASSDLFWEVIPAFIYKLRNKKIEWVQILHHIYPDWKKRPGSKVVSFFGYYFQRFSLLLIRKMADKIILMNSLIYNDLLGMGFNAEKMHVLSNGIDFEYLNLLKEGEISYEGVFLGRMNASKGVADLIPIWKKVCEKFPSARLAIIGGAEKTAKNNFIQQIKNNGLEKNIEVLGFLDDKDTFATMKAGKIFVFPSHEEGWGIAIAEACACGLPVIGWDLPVYKEIFEEYTLQIKGYDVNLFAEKIIDLLEDDNKREIIRNAGKEFIKRYSWENVAKRELEIILN